MMTLDARTKLGRCGMGEDFNHEGHEGFLNKFQPLSVIVSDFIFDSVFESVLIYLSVFFV